MKSIRYKGIDLHYNLSGRGRYVMLVHGFAEDSSAWSDICEELSKKYCVITPDLPGTGKSFRNIDDYTSMDDFALAIKAILEAEKIDQITMIGHSMGGYITMAFLALFPKMLNGIGLFHSTAFGDDIEKQRNRDRYIKFITAHGAAEFLQTSIPGLFEQPVIHSAYIQNQIQGAIQTGPQNLITYYRAMKNRPDRSGLLREFKIPVLIIAGQHDKTIPPEHSIQQAKMADVCHFHLLKKSAHMGFIEEPEKSKTILLLFLQHIDTIY